MLLVTGPPGSGKSAYVIDRVREELERTNSAFCLLTPTATMAEHLRNRMAREGFIFRPHIISTMSKFVEPWAGEDAEVSNASLVLLADQAVRRLLPNEFSAVAHLPGIAELLARAIEEVSSAGWTAEQLCMALQALSSQTGFASAFAAVYAEVENNLVRRRLALRAERLREAARKLRLRGPDNVRAVLIHGFFSLSKPELEVIEALSHHANLTITLPEWHGAEETRVALAAMGFEERRLVGQRTQPQVTVLEASTINHELEEIARRIVEEANRGRPLREIGIVVRNEEPYLPALRSILSRFGIPARFYFPDWLATHPVIQFFSNMLGALLHDWDWEKTLGALRTSVSGLSTAAGVDRLDFQVRQRIPRQGLEMLREFSKDCRIQRLLAALSGLDFWREITLTPAQWSEKLKALSSFVRPASSLEPETHELALTWRSYPQAVAAFETVLEQTGQAMDEEQPVSLEEFWNYAQRAIRNTVLRVPDRRRDVVHVMDTYEVRQWELPVVFICGLVEKQFPIHHAQDPILPDRMRLALRKAGLPVRTSTDKDLEEQMLFDFAVTRATDRLFLSYPIFNQKGDKNLRSYFLDRLPGSAATVRLANASRPRIRPQPLFLPTITGPSPILAPSLRDWLRLQHQAVSPTALEEFLQCPFLYFSRRTLHLQAPPPQPMERFSRLAQGSLAHKVLEIWMTTHKPVEEIFEQAFQQACAHYFVLSGYATEALRLELLRNLKRFLKILELPGAVYSKPETSFQFDVGREFIVRGRIDRIDYFEDGSALVIDYKYSPLPTIANLVKAHEHGTRVQGALYMLALEQQPGRRVCGMLFGAIRNGPGWRGWHLPMPGLERIGTSCDAATLRELMDRAILQVQRAVTEIWAGRIEPCPAEPQRCHQCEFRDICRIEAAQQRVLAGGMEG